MTTDQDKLIAEAPGRLAGITPGPWYLRPLASGKKMIKSRGTGETVYGPAGAKNPLSEEDVAAIAMFPQTVTALLAKVAELEGENNNLTASVEKLKQMVLEKDGNTWHSSFKKMEEVYADAVTERDEWKARAEALALERVELEKAGGLLCD